mmetsp:Transcript_53172/g.116394  ORF Transcript_53172/g.116394 Transcript_53172/m.116394 type:complete len:387 (-) Transcript_53172:1509-2669(-)
MAPLPFVLAAPPLPTDGAVPLRGDGEGPDTAWWQPAGPVGQLTCIFEPVLVRVTTRGEGARGGMGEVAREGKGEAALAARTGEPCGNSMEPSAKNAGEDCCKCSECCCLGDGETARDGDTARKGTTMQDGDMASDGASADVQRGGGAAVHAILGDAWRGSGLATCGDMARGLGDCPAWDGDRMRAAAVTGGTASVAPAGAAEATVAGQVPEAPGPGQGDKSPGKLRAGCGRARGPAASARGEAPEPKEACLPKVPGSKGPERGRHGAREVTQPAEGGGDAPRTGAGVTVREAATETLLPLARDKDTPCCSPVALCGVATRPPRCISADMAAAATEESASGSNCLQGLPGPWLLAPIGETARGRSLWPEAAAAIKEDPGDKGLGEAA